MDNKTVDLVVVLGHTAGGKTAFAAQLAHRIGGEIISADSRQVYRGMDIGTGKDYGDYLVEGERIPAYLIDIVDAGYEYNVYLFKQDFLRVFNEIVDRDKVPVLCGGSGLYIESVLRNYKLLHVPVNSKLREDLDTKSYEELEGILRLYGPLHNETDTVNRKRLIRAIEIAMYQDSLPELPDELPAIRPLVLGIKHDRNIRRQRITERLKQRLDEGLVEEVEGLMGQGITPEKMYYYGLEYRFLSQYILQKEPYDEMFSKLNTAIHQFAKRQMTYFRGMERRGIPIHWLDGQFTIEEKIEQALTLYFT
ncbi:MAG: tRNA (adenosine(37)-N6)-dimethylallyltransferase MiaA [Bacteroidales bacterium]|nr:tRNA (adenosine(37)-N6)-dimethylallyltransferase MiaA [Bacteroidales bacterium]